MQAVSFACPDWFEKLKRGESPIPQLPLDMVLADGAVALYDKLRVPNIPGTPTNGEAGGEWMRNIVRAAFGSIDPETGDRLVGEIFNLVPKKNGKTTNAADLGIIALMMNRRPNISGIVVGPTQEVAETCFDMACQKIELDDYLRRRFRIIGHKKTILDLHVDTVTGQPRNARLKIKSFDPKVVTGGIPAFAILDELHVMAQAPYASRVLNQIRGGMITNPESLLIIITTQSEVPPFGIFKDELDYARGVRDGRITEGVRMLPILHEFPEYMQLAESKPWADPENWHIVLPNLGRSITIERLVAEWRTAQAKGERAAREWASQHLNVQIGMAMHDARWEGADFWLSATGAPSDLREFIARCDLIVAGVDGGGLDDLLGLALVGREHGTGRWLAWVRAWAHKLVLERRKGEADRLLGLERSGFMKIVDRPGDDLDEVADILQQVDRAGVLAIDSAVGVDSYGVSAIVQAIVDRNISERCIVSVSQGWKLNGAIKTTARMLAAGTLVHEGSDLMAWCVGNAKTVQVGNAVAITKQVSGARKIDPLMALFNAVTVMGMNPTVRGKPQIFAL